MRISTKIAQAQSISSAFKKQPTVHVCIYMLSVILLSIAHTNSISCVDYVRHRQSSKSKFKRSQSASIMHVQFASLLRSVVQHLVQCDMVPEGGNILAC